LYSLFFLSYCSQNWQDKYTILLPHLVGEINHIFIFRTLGSHFLEPAQQGQVLTGGGHYLKLLGIHWGQFPEEWKLKNLPSESEAHKASLITDGKYVLGLSGMTCVIPAACILEVLNLPELDEMRTLENCYKT
jgi:hypothetical protein